MREKQQIVGHFFSKRPFQESNYFSVESERIIWELPRGERVLWRLFTGRRSWDEGTPLQLMYENIQP